MPDMFKKGLHLKVFPKKYKLLNYSRGPSQINDSRIRMGLSTSNSQRHSCNFIAYRHCTTYNAEKEDECHFFMHCDTYIDIRHTMINE